MIDALETVQRFLDAGGFVLWLIAAVAVFLATMIIERYWYFRLDFPAISSREVSRWNERQDRHSWYAKRIREAMIADLSTRLGSTLPLIRVSIALCPMLGLLGTVTGMMGVFDVIAVLGTGNARAMASGISRATIPTMAGMTVVIPSLYFYTLLKREVERCVEGFADHLSIG